ncbi:MAG TPA: MbnP family copper-binding protein [Polyangiaceae bacterium]|nr:MbnP family copper-binding protein [Polyangiaceae bacterium]
MRKRVRCAAWLFATGALSMSAGCGDDDDGEVTADAGAGGFDAGHPPDSGAGLDASTLADTGVDGGDAAAALQAVTLRFAAKVGSRDFACGETYAAQGSTKVTATPTDFRFYVQNVRLLTTNGQEVPVELDERAPWQTQDVALIDFTTTSGQCSAGNPGTNMIITGHVPAGTYRGIAFVNGVPESINHQDFSTAKPPLDDPTTSWNWMLGYRFLLAEIAQVAEAAAMDGGVVSLLDAGPADATTADGGAPALGQGILHIGSTACTGTPASGFTCSKPNRNEIRLSSFDPSANVIVADLAAVFANTDLSQVADCHSSGDACPPMFSAVGIDFATGNALTTQQLFHVE